MRLHRFYINKEIKKEVHVDDKELLHQWIKVFRLKASDPSQIKSQFDGVSRIIIFNGGNSEYEAYFKILSKQEAILIVDKEIKNPHQSASNPRSSASVELHIFQSIIKKDNFEFVVEKCTEIGVSAFHPIISERSEKKNLNLERLNKIAKESAEQSGKTALPKIFNPELLEKAILGFDGELFVLDFDGENFSSSLRAKCGNSDNPSQIKSQFDGARKIGILIGPEGGWTEKERGLFKQKGIKSVSFGPQILRAETASIVASALILFK